MKCTATLRFIGDLDFEAVTSAMEISPTFKTQRGDKDVLGGLVDVDVWGVSSPLTEADTLQDHMSWFVNRFADKGDEIERIRGESKVDIIFGITFTDQSGFSLGRREIAFLSANGIELEISLICV